MLSEGSITWKFAIRYVPFPANGSGIPPGIWLAKGELATMLCMVFSSGANDREVKRAAGEVGKFSTIQATQAPVRATH
ncbi:hypothetical protein GCM10027456_31740 [Kineosporia babensis]